MSNEKMVWLVIEKNVYTTPLETFTVVKNAYSLEGAIEYKLALEKLNDRKNQSYFIATEMSAGVDYVIEKHNESVKNGSYYEKHPEVKRPA
tara:strand:- start:571 stop:843 length:273 start_codon:yes stop_codon:yes gene_type:complete